MTKKVNRVGALLLALLIVFTTIYLPEAKVGAGAGASVYDQYNVTFKVTGEDDAVLEDAVITVQKSEDGQTFEPLTETSDKTYVLDSKSGDNFLVYKFNITAEGYLDKEETFSFDPNKENNCFDPETADRDLTITSQMETDPNLYYLEIKAVDENGNSIEGINVNMNWSVDSYGSYNQEAKSPGVYVLQKKRDNGDLLYYQFTVSKDGYTSHEGTKFCFDPLWASSNPYFNVRDGKHFITITVTMMSSETALDNAKTKAVEELRSYKNLNDYRPAEQMKIAELIDTWTNKINMATTVNSVSWNLDQAKNRLDKLKTNEQYEEEEYRSRIYFLTDDGEMIQADQYGVITITNIDSGNFYITDPDGTPYTNDGSDTKWRCVYEYEDQDHPGNIAFQVVVGTYGQYAGKFVGSYDATVTLNDTGKTIPFTVRVISGRVDKLRASIDGKDVSGKTINVMGSEKKTATIEGRLKGTDRWVTMPWHALKYTAGGSTSVLPATGEFRTWGTSGTMTYTLDADRSVSVTVYINATIVMPTGIEVICPSTATVGDWNGVYNQYVGIMEGQNGYRVIVTPSNASNTGVVWEDLTPDVATFQKAHALGIVPKKAGTAKFKVSCSADPSISTTVTILFKYEKPLKTAEAEKSVYYAKTTDKTIDLKIITNGQSDSSKGASEQRFNWSYSTSGVVKVSDEVHYDESSVTIPNWFTHKITILGAGVVYVTGTPYDMTEDCKPVTFKVVVTDPIKDSLNKQAAERIEGLISSIGKVTLDKKDQIEFVRSEYNKLTKAQKNLIDEDIYDLLLKAEEELKKLESEQSGGGGNNGGTSSPEESETGNQTQENVSGDTADGDDQNDETNTVVTEVDGGNSDPDLKTPEASAQNSSISKFFEVDIHEVNEAVAQYVSEFNPVAKAAIFAGVPAAFLFGFMWRRHQYLKTKNKK